MGPRLQVKNLYDCRRAGDREKDAGQALEGLDREDHRERSRAQREFGPIHPSASDLDGDRPDVPQRPCLFDFDADQLGRLAHENRERDSIHVPVADWLREKLGHEPQTRDAGKDANRAGDDGHHSGKRDGAIDISSGERSRYAQNDGGQRGVGPEHQDSAGAEERIGQKGYDGRVEAIDAWKARGDGIRDPNRRQGRRENQAGCNVVREPTRFIASQRCNSRQPADPA